LIKRFVQSLRIALAFMFPSSKKKLIISWSNRAKTWSNQSSEIDALKIRGLPN